MRVSLFKLHYWKKICLSPVSVGGWSSVVVAVTYCDLHFDRVRGEVDHHWQHGHRSERDAPREEEKEDQAAKQNTQTHGDAHIQLPEIQKQALLTSQNKREPNAETI